VYRIHKPFIVDMVKGQLTSPLNAGQADSLGVESRTKSLAYELEAFFYCGGMET
jgi:hypothetical protein